MAKLSPAVISVTVLRDVADSGQNPIFVENQFINTDNPNVPTMRRNKS
jgi:hypothetical protein